MKPEMVVKWCQQAVDEATERLKASCQVPPTEHEIRLFRVAFSRGFMACYSTFKIQGEIES